MTELQAIRQQMSAMMPQVREARSPSPSPRRPRVHFQDQPQQKTTYQPQQCYHQQPARPFSRPPSPAARRWPPQSQPQQMSRCQPWDLMPAFQVATRVVSPIGEQFVLIDIPFASFAIKNVLCKKSAGRLKGKANIRTGSLSRTNLVILVVIWVGRHRNSVLPESRAVLAFTTPINKNLLKLRTNCW